MKRRAAFWLQLPVLIAAGALLALARRSELLQVLESKTLDWRFRNFSRASRRDPRIALAMVDQQSLDAFERDGVYWPWPRSLYGAALDFCKAGGAKAVVMDVLFTGPSPYGPSEDRQLADALRRNGNVVLALETGRGSVHLPVPALAAAAAGMGDASAAADADGVFRRVPLASEAGGKRYPTLAAAAALALSRSKDLGSGTSEVSVGDFRVPVRDGLFWVRFHGRALSPAPGAKTYEAYPLGRLIQSWENIEEGRKPDLDPGALKGKIVFIGLSAPGLLDLRPSPVAPASAGTEILAAAVDNILNHDFLRPAGAGAGWALILGAALAAGAWASLAAGAWTAAAGMLALAGALAALAIFAFTRGVWLDMAAPQLAAWLAFAEASAYGYATEGRKRKEIQNAFGHYLAPELVQRIAEAPEALALGGERKEITTFFSDIAGFTTISEGLEPERLTWLMNRYLGLMTDIILANGGTLDKYVGDAIMALWGAPLERPDHALAACKTALENQERLAELRRELESRGLPRVEARIGINSGPAAVGNMGSSRRFAYTALGDSVNLASRLEGANKVFGTRVMISEATRALVADAVETRELDFLKVKGKETPIRVYELLGLKGRAPAALVEKARLFEDGLADYRRRRWADALRVFRTVEARFGEDKASAVYARRCADFAHAPPAQAWDGSTALAEK